MSYFIFLPNLDNIEGTLYRIAENESDLNNLNIDKSVYKIIEDSQSNFNLVKYGNKSVKYNNNTLIYSDQIFLFKNKIDLEGYIVDIKNPIKNFTKANLNHPSFNIWNNYYNQLNSLDLNTITYPLNKSLEQYFNDLGQPSLNLLQIP
jgi:hypothetical protein